MRPGKRIEPVLPADRSSWPSFALYRILGNDLPPRHVSGQTLDNARFILENEPELAGCTKHWVLNRIADPEAEANLVALLEAHGQSFVRIPFDPDELAAREWDVAAFRDGDFIAALGEPIAEEPLVSRIEYRIRLEKNRYVMNNNGARNFVVEQDAGRSDYVLPFDGSIFVTTEAWEAIVAAACTHPPPRYLIVPMARLGSDPEVLLRDGIPAAAHEEPQIGLHRDAEARFNDALGYGRRSKIELLGRLGVSRGHFVLDLDRWDIKPLARPSDRERHVVAGRVARLPSGSQQQEVGERSATSRHDARKVAIATKLDALDRDYFAARLDPRRLMLFDPLALQVAREASAGSVAALVRGGILETAEAAEARGIRTVLDKTAIAPSGDPRDYHSRAPFWWPDPRSPTGLPYVRRDGVRAPETDAAQPESAAFDGVRLQTVLLDTIACALATRLSGDPRHAEFGAALVRSWFLAPETAMKPNFAYAQVRPGNLAQTLPAPSLRERVRRRLGRLRAAFRLDPAPAPAPAPPTLEIIGGETGRGAGLIEIRDLPAFLDAARMLAEMGSLSSDELDALRSWCAEFATWMRTSRQGGEARRSRNNIGTYYDVEMLALAAFLGDASEIAATLRRMRVRLKFQFDEQGGQTLEVRRTRPIHYSCLNLFGWAQFSTMASRLGIDVPGWGGGQLRQALQALLDLGRDRFARERPDLAAAYSALETLRVGFGLQPDDVRPVAEGVGVYAPFWQLHDVTTLAEVSRPVASPARQDAPVA